MERPSHPDRTTVACPACGKGVDVLRAGHVAILDGGFRYFCDEACKRAFVLDVRPLLPSQVETAEPPRVALRSAPVEPVAAVPSDLPGFRAPTVTEVAEVPPTTLVAVALPPEERPPLAREPAPAPLPPVAAVTPAGKPSPPPSRERPTLGARVAGAVTVAGVAAGLLAPSVWLLGATFQASRFPLATIAVAACVARGLLVPREPSDVHPAVSILAAVAMWAVALLARNAGHPEASAFAAATALAGAAQLASAVLVDRAREGVGSARRWIEGRLDVPVRVERASGTVVVSASEVKSGEPVVAIAGETVGVDGRVTAGDAVMTPWIDADVETRKQEGDPVVAGARVLSGTVRAVTTWSGEDRAWVRLSCSPDHSADVDAPFVRRVRTSLERGAFLVGAVMAALAMANGTRGLELLAIAALSAFAAAGCGSVSVMALHQARGTLSALAYGVVYRDARAFERAGQADVAVLCSRTTLLLGSPELVALEALGPAQPSRVIALAAGSMLAVAHGLGPVLAAAARERSAEPESVRHATHHSGMGVTALTGGGDRIAVGSRSLLLQEKVSVAVADARVTALEAEGRSVTLVALGGKLVGLIATQDGLRQGARAAVQRLLDAHIEPVILGGEARETCETIGHAIDVDHIRPEVLPQDRGGAVRALADGGRVVAVLGKPGADDAALGAADVSVALGAAGASAGEWAIALATDDVRSAARALSIATECRQRTRVAMALGLGPGALATAGIALGLLPLAAAPVFSVVGLTAAVVHARR